MADPEVIHQQMEETRARLAENLDKLTAPLVDTVQEVSASVAGTVEAVQETVETVSESVHGVQDFFNLKDQVDRNPWFVLGGAVVVGYFLSKLLTPPTVTVPTASSSASLTPTPSNGIHGTSRLEGHWPEDPKSESQSQGWLGGITEQLGPVFDKVKGLAIGATLSMARNALTSSLQGDLGNQVRHLIDDVTVQLGGKPILQEASSPATHTPKKGAKDEQRHSTKMDRPVGADPR